MRKRHALILAGLFVAVTAATAVAADYDRYERGPRGGSRGEYAPPPPRRGAEVPPPRHAQYGQPYFLADIGLFSPNSSSDGLSGYDSGGNIQLGIGSRVSPVFAVEGTVGGYGAKRGSDEATVVPLTIGGRFILPHPFLEPYFNFGLGLYSVNLKEDPAASRRGFINYSGIDDKTNTEFGGYLGGGLDAWMNPRTALNVDLKYHIVDSTFDTRAGNSVNVDLSGWTVNFGVRVAF